MTWESMLQEAVTRLGASLGTVRNESPAAIAHMELARRQHAHRLLARAGQILGEMSGVLGARTFDDTPQSPRGDDDLAELCRQLVRSLTGARPRVDGEQRQLGDLCRGLRDASRQLLQSLPYEAEYGTHRGDRVVVGERRKSVRRTGPPDRVL